MSARHSVSFCILVAALSACATPERHYRYVVALLDTPLYGLALYQTARCYDELGRTEAAAQARDEVLQLGCADHDRRIPDGF